MHQPPEQSLWSGRLDLEDGEAGRRWHQVVAFAQTAAPAVALLGLASDRGVTLNKGRPGAAAGPEALRRNLANLAWHHECSLYDDGDIIVTDDLPAGQRAYGDRLAGLLQQEQFVLGLGGGHEIAWAGYLGCRQYLDAHAPGKALGILNLDAHFDLRRPSPDASSGTPFYQVAQHCGDAGRAFHYACLGVARTANTRALFQRADELRVDYLLDTEFSLSRVETLLRQFLSRLDYLYFTCCLDVFAACHAPGVSAPAALGLEPARVIEVMHLVGELCREYAVTWLLADVAELSPVHDLDSRTARLGARVLDTLVAARLS